MTGVTKGWAARAEQSGFAGILLADSETLVADPYVELALAGTATNHLQLGVGVTNPVTRHPAVTAAAIATVQAESGGRAVLGFARGDSALRQLSLAPASVGALRQAVLDVRRYLGDPLSTFGDRASTAVPLSWLSDSYSRVPVDVAATGPAVIAMGAVLADRLTFNLGADVGLLGWAVDHAKEARSAAGMNPDSISLGAYIDVACAPRDEAVAMVRGSASIFAQFLEEGMHSGVPVSSEDRAILDAVATRYSESEHGRSTAPQAELLSDDFLQRFALCGRADVLLPRVRALRDLGIDRLVVVPASRDVDAAVTERSVSAFARDVMPFV